MRVQSADEPILKARLGDEEEEATEGDDWEDKFGEEEPETKKKLDVEDEVEDFSLFEEWEEEYA